MISRHIIHSHGTEDASVFEHTAVQDHLSKAPIVFSRRDKAKTPSLALMARRIAIDDRRLIPETYRRIPVNIIQRRELTVLDPVRRDQAPRLPPRDRESRVYHAQWPEE